MIDPTEIPPCDLDAEKALLGAILIEPATFDDYAPRLDPEDFHSVANARLFATFHQMRDEGKPLDFVVLQARLRQSDQLEAVGGAAYLAELISGYKDALNVNYYAGIVADMSLRRKMLDVSESLQVEIRHVDTSAATLLSRQLQSLQGLADAAPRKTLYDAVSITAEAFRFLDNVEESPIATGYERLDDVLGGGFYPKNLVVIGARPRGGKTAAAVNLMQNIGIRAGVPCFLHSLEMTAPEIYFRMLSNESGVFSSKLRAGAAVRGVLSDIDRDRITATAGKLSASPFWIDDKSGASVSEIAASIRLHRRRHGVRVFFIDYAGIINAEHPDRSMREQVGGIALAFKRIAKDLGVVVVLLAQLNRESVKPTNGKLTREKLIATRPRLEHLKESSGLEENADVVILIHRPELMVGRDEAAVLDLEGYAEWIVAKNRNGRQGEIPMRFAGEFVRFEECDDTVMMERNTVQAGDDMGEQPSEISIPTGETQRTFDDEF